MYDSLPESQKETMNAILQLYRAYEPIKVD
jgi:hypothetical protein